MDRSNRFYKSVFISAIVTILAFSLSIADNRVNSGKFNTTAAGTTAGYTISGMAVMARRGDTVTFVTTHVTGLKPRTTYGSHVHNLPCSMGGGAHYKTNPADTTVQASNEIWPLLTTDSTGTANAFVSVPFKVRPEGQSIVIHDTTAAKTKIACADLLDDNTESFFTTVGAFKRFPDTATTLEGSASMVRYRYEDSTTVRITVAGLLASTAYGCHVHLLPGSIQSGGGHYKIDPTVTAAVDTNEIWLNFTTDAMGAATMTVTSHHLARPEAQSIVIHAPGGRRIGWADLVAPAASGLTSAAIISGNLVTTAAGTAAGYTNLVGQGLILREYGKTVAAVKVSGLVKNKAYGSHVHNLPCSATPAGGGHYKIDTTVATAVDTNEIWTLLKTDTAGTATGFGFAPNHEANATAQSIVVHDTVTGARIACIDFMGMTTGIKLSAKATAEPDGMYDLGFNNFRIQTEGNFTLRLYNLEGKRVLTRVGSGMQVLNFDGLNKGHYFSRITFPGSSVAPITMGIFIK